MRNHNDYLINFGRLTRQRAADEKINDVQNSVELTRIN